MMKHATFEDHQFAARFRDWVRQVVADEIEKLRPRYRYAVVDTVDTVNKIVSVTYPDGTSGIKIRYGSLVPSAGDTIRIAGLPNDRYVDDVVNPA